MDRSKTAEEGYVADRVSGISGRLFALSVVLEVVAKTEERSPYRFPFYGLTMELAQGRMDEWIWEQEFDELVDQIMLDVREEGLDYFTSATETIQREAGEFQAWAVGLVADLATLTDAELIDRYDGFINRYFHTYGLGAVVFLYEHILSERLARSLAKRYPDATEMIEQLLESDYQSFMVASEHRLAEVRDEHNAARKEELAEKYVRDFFYIKSSYMAGPLILIEDVLGEAAELSGSETYEERRGRLDLSGRTLTEEERLVISLLKASEVIRDERKRINLIGSYSMFRFLDEAVRRTDFPARLAPNIFWYEYKDLISRSRELLPVITARTHVTCLYDDEGRTHYLEEIVITPREVVDFGVTEISGTPAARGKVRGAVTVVLGSTDFAKLRDGDVLVAEMTRPDYVSIMKKAAAIVTDEGSLTSHAAIVARELGVPCVVGTKVATQVLKDGDEVEVDADTGVVRKL